MLPFFAPEHHGQHLQVDGRDVRRIGLLACRFLNEPWSRALRMPWDEIVRGVFEGQEIEAEDGLGAQIKALTALTAAMMGG